jgi:excinuclease ABC subunit C
MKSPSAAVSPPNTSSGWPWEADWHLCASEPGVYWFLDSAGHVLYVGKAKNLHNRVGQYRQYRQLSTFKQQLVSTAVSLRHQVLTSEIEALLVEAELIARYQPHYNILLKDDRSPLYIVITKESYPRVLTARRNELAALTQVGTIIGPLSSGYMVQKVLRAVRPIFQWCNTPQSGRPCFYYHLDQCSGACVGAIEPGEYRRSLKKLTQFLQGKTHQVQRQLRKEIEDLAAKQQYEAAATKREQWEAMQRLIDPSYDLGPDLAVPVLSAEQDWQPLHQLAEWFGPRLHQPTNWLPRRVEVYDVSNFQGKYAAVSMVVGEEGKIARSQYRIFHIRSLKTPNDYAMMAEALVRRQKHPEWGQPDLVVIDGGLGQLHTVQAVWQWSNPVISLAKEPDRLCWSVNGQDEMVTIDNFGEGGRFLQRLRDEAHRFSKRHATIRLNRRSTAL